MSATVERDLDCATPPRPLQVLIPLIAEQLRHGRDAAQRAALPYYQTAGALMLEARAQLEHGEFHPWVRQHFNVGRKAASIYMNFARASGTFPAGHFSSLTEFVRQTSNPNYNRPAIGRVNADTLNRRRDELRRADERTAERQLALQVIDLGFKVLARKLHPDRGGSREAMAQLNKVRHRLKRCA
jgi:hypothetical protein